MIRLVHILSPWWQTLSLVGKELMNGTADRLVLGQSLKPFSSPAPITLLLGDPCWGRVQCMAEDETLGNVFSLQYSAPSKSIHTKHMIILHQIRVESQLRWYYTTLSHSLTFLMCIVHTMSRRMRRLYKCVQELMSSAHKLLYIYLYKHVRNNITAGFPYTHM